MQPKYAAQKGRSHPDSSPPLIYGQSWLSDDDMTIAWSFRSAARDSAMKAECQFGLNELNSEMKLKPRGGHRPFEGEAA
jgi:hypothetical protein